MYDVTEPSVENIIVAKREPLAVEGIRWMYIHINNENEVQI